ncbi:hypothetical protein IMZ48_25815 [Candidatus Bathyarchaeota archaeon]|nr:hypothetical protein [Candidatus Bathyarchaeota archaeon]
MTLGDGVISASAEGTWWKFFVPGARGLVPEEAPDVGGQGGEADDGGEDGEDGLGDGGERLRKTVPDHSAEKGNGTRNQKNTIPSRSLALPRHADPTASGTPASPPRPRPHHEMRLPVSPAVRFSRNLPGRESPPSPMQRHVSKNDSTGPRTGPGWSVGGEGGCSVQGALQAASQGARRCIVLRVFRTGLTYTAGGCH